MSLAAATQNVAAGALFGAALLAAGVAAPDVIRAQLRLADYAMMVAFLMASGFSAVAVAASAAPAATATRPARRLVLVDLPYSANIAGGALLGVGMALTGACPGTTLVQLAAGVSSGGWVVAGGVGGAVAYEVLGGPALLAPAPAPRTRAQQAKQQPATLDALFGTSRGTILAAYTAATIFAALALPALLPVSPAGLVSPALGGVLIGLAQAATILLTARAVGASGAYGDIAAWLVKGAKSPAALATPSVLFAAGVVAGAGLLAAARNPMAGAPGVPAPTALAGGALALFGARLAGGCTSGHGISGMATLSVASFVTVASMFAGGIGAALVGGL